MDSGYYAACAALMSRTRALDTVANNLANTATPGYRTQHNTFRSELASVNTAALSPLNQAMNEYGVHGGTRLDNSQGTLQQTGNDLDLAIQGPGFFVVQTPGGRFFTRSGSFQVSPTGQLITSQGDPVMGENGVIPIVGGPVSISQDGTISVNGAIAGKLKVVEFAPGTSLASEGNGYYSAPARSDADAKNSSVRQGMIENSNVNAVASMIELISVQRTAEMMQRALGLFNSEINKTATRDLPRLG